MIPISVCTYVFFNLGGLFKPPTMMIQTSYNYISYNPLKYYHSKASIKYIRSTPASYNSNGKSTNFAAIHRDLPCDFPWLQRVVAADERLQATFTWRSSLSLLFGSPQINGLTSSIAFNAALSAMVKALHVQRAFQLMERLIKDTWYKEVFFPKKTQLNLACKRIVLCNCYLVASIYHDCSSGSVFSWAFHNLSP